MPKKTTYKRVKAWAIVKGDNNGVLSNWGITLAIFTTKEKAKVFLGTAENTLNPWVIPCTITYALPTKPLKDKKR